MACPANCKKRPGITAARWEFLVRFFPSPGILTEEIFLYLARDLSEGTQNLMGDEDIEVIKLTLGDAIARIGSGEIADAKTIVGLLMTRERLNA